MSGDVELKIRRDPQLCHFLAVLFAVAEWKEKSLEWLEQAVNQGFINYPLMAAQDPLLEPIRGEERFQKLMKRAKHEWEDFDA